MDLLSTLKPDDPLAVAFSPPRDHGSFAFKRGGSVYHLDVGKTREQATQLMELLKEQVHERVGRVDSVSAAELYEPLLTLLFEQRQDLSFFTTNYDRSVEVIWEQGLHARDLGLLDVSCG